MVLERDARQSALWRRAYTYSVALTQKNKSAFSCVAHDLYSCVDPTSLRLSPFLRNRHQHVSSPFLSLLFPYSHFFRHYAQGWDSLFAQCLSAYWEPESLSAQVVLLFSGADVSGQVWQTASEEKPSTVTETPEMLSYVWGHRRSAIAASQCNQGFASSASTVNTLKCTNLIKCVDLIPCLMFPFTFRSKF